MSPARSFDALDDGKQETQTTVAALRLLPLMIGWFAMNAPSGLGLYWVFNNILTTTQVASASVCCSAPNSFTAARPTLMP